MAHSDDDWDLIADEFEDHLAQGGLVNDFFGTKGKPSRHTFYARMKRDSNLEERYERALKWRAILMMDEMERICTAIEAKEMSAVAGGILLKNLQWRSERFFKKLFGTPQVAQVTGNDDVKALILAAMKRQPVTIEAPIIDMTVNGQTSQ